MKDGRDGPKARATTPYEAYRARAFAACGLFDAASISAGLQRMKPARARRRRIK